MPYKRKDPKETDSYESKKLKVEKSEKVQKEFLSAVLHGKLDEVEKFLKLGTIDVEDKNNSEACTALHFASRSGNIPIIKELLKNGANIEATQVGYSGQIPIHFAVTKGQRSLLHIEDPNRSSHLDVVKFLLQNGANLHTLAGKGDTILHICEVPEVIEFLIESGVSTNARNEFQETPIYDAIGKFGNIDKLRVLLKNGAKVNIENNEKMSPLFYAMKENSPEYQKTEFVMELLKHGANPNLTKYAPLQLAMEKSHFKIAKQLIQHGAKVNIRCKRNQTPLHIAAKNGQVELVKDLLKNGAKVQARNDQKETPLLLAVSTVDTSTAKLTGPLENHIQTVEELIKHGANVNAIYENEISPILEAVHVESPELAMLLLDHGANPNVKDILNCTPLHYAAEYKFVTLVEKLSKHGANPNAEESNRNYTPLHVAIDEEYYQSEQDMINIVLLLLKNGANPNSITKTGYTPLSQMISSPKLASILLDHGANVNSDYDGSGLTPLHWWLHTIVAGFTQEQEEIVKIMVKNCKDIDFKIQFEGNTVLESALEKGYHNIVKMMFFKKNVL